MEACGLTRLEDTNHGAWEDCTLTILTAPPTPASTLVTDGSLIVQGHLSPPDEQPLDLSLHSRPTNQDEEEIRGSVYDGKGSKFHCPIPGLGWGGAGTLCHHGI
ncbi:hypothetical protein MRX96_023256 [Rhipicephalus microplus]